MSNKKGGVAFDQIGGALAFMIGITFLIMIIFVYYAFDSKKSIEESELAVSELNTIEALNFFLDISVESDRKVRDLIKEAYINGDYQEIENEANKFFPKKFYNWKIFFFRENYILFEIPEFIGGGITDKSAYSETYVLVRSPEKQILDKITVVLQTN